MTEQKSTENSRQRLTVWLVIGGLVLLALAAVFVLGSMGLFTVVSSETTSGELTQLEPFEEYEAAPASGSAPGGALPGPGDPAPDFVLFDVQGNQVSLSDFRGQPVMLNFWATWCAPCRLEMPEMEEAQRDYAEQGLVILAINQEESADQVQTFLNELGLTFTAPLDEEGEVAEQYGAFFLPSSVFINPAGEITAFHRGIIARSQIDGYLTDMGLN